VLSAHIRHHSLAPRRPPSRATLFPYTTLFRSGGHVVLKDGLAVQADPGVGRAGDGHLDVGVGLHILVDILAVVGAEPELAVHLAGEHEGPALGLAVPADGGEILDGVLLQKLHDFIHGSYLLMLDVGLQWIACRYNPIGEIKIVSSQTVIWLCRFPKHSNIEILTGAESGKIACLVSIQELLTM